MLQPMYQAKLAGKSLTALTPMLLKTLPPGDTAPSATAGSGS
jgi:hypothetical protein